jgi:hypothetical protein
MRSQLAALCCAMAMLGTFAHHARAQERADAAQDRPTGHLVIRVPADWQASPVSPPVGGRCCNLKAAEKGALIGGAIGALLGAVLIPALCEENSCAMEYVELIGWSAAMGAGIGLIHPDRVGPRSVLADWPRGRRATLAYRASF